MEQQKNLEKHGLLGKLSPGEKKLEEKTFYFDRVKRGSTTLLLELITLFGGKVESFLHKEVSFVVTGSLEELKEREALDSNAKITKETTPKQRENGLRPDRQRQGSSTPSVNACGSRGKALLEKAILNKERQQGTSVLTNARSWGVKILYAQDVLFYLKQLSREHMETKSKKSEKATKQVSNVVKAAPLRSPYLKIEDSNRKYKPLHMQSITFPTLYYSGRYSPFECPPPPRFDKWTEPEEKKNKENKVVVSTEDKCQTPLSCTPSPWKQRKKDAYCECCRQNFNNQEEHLLCDQHRAFVLDSSNYTAIDQLIASMLPGFDPDPPQKSEDHKQETVTTSDPCELELLTDLETEDAVKELHTQETTVKFDDPVLIRDSVSPSIDNPPPQIQQQKNNPNVDLLALPSSPAMPVLEMMSQEPPLLEPHQDFKPLSPISVNTSPNSDLFFPPVLSPQELDSYTHSSYLEPPILSPHKFLSQEIVNKATVFQESLLCVSQSFSLDSQYKAVTAAKTPEKTKGEINVCYKSWERRSCSLPRQSTTAINLRKRSRSASPESSSGKRRRTNERGAYQAKCAQKTEDIQLFLKPARTISSVYTNEKQDLFLGFGNFIVPHEGVAAQWLPILKQNPSNASMTVNETCPNVGTSQQLELSNSHSTSVCIESALIPDMAALSSSSSDSDWDCELLSRLSAPPKTSSMANENNCDLNQALLQQPCPWLSDSSYESRLHSALQPPTQPLSVEPTTFSRTPVPIVEVQH